MPKLIEQQAMRAKTIAPLGVLLLVFIILTTLSWHKSGDILIDFGRELYTPWRLSLGEVLHRDVATLFGPFSSYWNGLLFKIFGASVQTLVVANLVLLALVTLLLYDLFRLMSNNWVAVLAGFLFLVAAGFPHFMRLGNYNFLTPYSHKMTHGFFLSIFLIRRSQVRILPGSLTTH
jgi:hypothetical protein